VEPVLPVLTAADAAAFADCVAAGGVAVFPADTVYGLAARAGDADALERLYALKGRAPSKPAATMWFSREAALAALPAAIGPRTRTACERLLPGGVTLLLPAAAPADSPAAPAVPPAGGRPAAAGPQAALGIRVPRLTPALQALEAVPHAIVQSSANVAGGPDPRTVAEIPPAIREGADLVLDAGPLPGTPSTVIDLRGYEARGEWEIVREGALPRGEAEEVLGIVGRP
jgi:L-threonylcarbamoyladenylate synthase